MGDPILQAPTPILASLPGVFIFSHNILVDFAKNYNLLEVVATKTLCENKGGGKRDNKKPLRRQKSPVQGHCPTINSQGLAC